LTHRLRLLSRFHSTGRPVHDLVVETDRGRRPMELFTKLFGAWLVFVYHCFDRIVLSGYLMGLQRPGQVVYWLQHVLGIEAITKEVLSSRTDAYVRWVEAFARNHSLQIRWHDEGVRMEDYVRPYLLRMERENRFGVYFIFQAMERGWTFRPVPLAQRHPGGPADYPILRCYRSRYRYYYFYIRDEVLGALVVRIGTFLPFEASYYLNGHHFIERELIRTGVEYRKDDNAFLSVADRPALQAAADRFSPELIQRRLNYWTVAIGPKFARRDRRSARLERSYYLHQVEYCLNFIFLRNHPIRKLFERSCELSLWRMTGDKIWRAFGRGHRDRIRGKLQTIMDGIEHGQHVFRAYWKHAWVKQYEKFRTFLRMEVTSNNLRDFKLHKGLAYLDDVRQRLYQVVDRFAGQQAVNLNVHDDFALLRRIALPVETSGRKTAGIRLEDARMIRLMEVLLHAGSSVGGWTARQIHRAVLDRFELPAAGYHFNSLRYDLRKLKGHGLLEREARRYAYRLSDKGQRVAVLFVLFHQRLCGPVAGGQFRPRPEQRYCPQSPLERAYHKADQAIDEIVSVLRAA
jgi:hypothetical protein